eukprot:775954-Pleurochrysis_carterae.AAC.1
MRAHTRTCTNLPFPQPSLSAQGDTERLSVDRAFRQTCMTCFVKCACPVSSATNLHNEPTLANIPVISVVDTDNQVS